MATIPISKGPGASWPKSRVACSEMEICKHPYCVDFTVEFTPHSTHCCVTRVTIGHPITHSNTHILSTTCKCYLKALAPFAKTSHF